MGLLFCIGLRVFLLSGLLYGRMEMFVGVLPVSKRYNEQPNWFSLMESRGFIRTVTLEYHSVWIGSVPESAKWSQKGAQSPQLPRWVMHVSSCVFSAIIFLLSPSVPFRIQKRYRYSISSLNGSSAKTFTWGRKEQKIIHVNCIKANRGFGKSCLQQNQNYKVNLILLLLRCDCTT